MSTLLNTVLPIVGVLLLFAVLYHLHKRKLRIQQAEKKTPAEDSTPATTDRVVLSEPGNEFLGIYWNAPYEITTGNP